MPNQTITLEASGMWYETNSWAATGVSGDIFTSTYPEGLGMNFLLDTEIPEGSTITSAFVSVHSNSFVGLAGESVININIYDADPATAAAWSTSPNPDTAAAVTSSPHQTPSFDPQEDTPYFGDGETQEISITDSIQDLLDSYGTLEVGDRIGIWLEADPGGGAGQLVCSDEDANMELFIEWTEPAGGSFMPASFSSSITRVRS